MARELVYSNHQLAEFAWIGSEAKCPICNQIFNSWYCPHCGLPKNNSAYNLSNDNKFYRCGSNHFRKGFWRTENFQLCSKCYTPNPYNATFCRNCGENISTQASDRNGHSWVDLGLSVLWSTENLFGYYQWNNSVIFGDNENFRDLYDKYEKTDGKDAATYQWGKKWRTPTVTELEELVNNCKWEKCLIGDLFALKATGPNGNSIILPFRGVYRGSSFWTSTTCHNSTMTAYRFCYKDWFLHLQSVATSCTSSNFRQDTEYFKKVQQRCNEVFDFIKLIRNNKALKRSLFSGSPIDTFLTEIRDIIMHARIVDHLPKYKLEKWKDALDDFITKEGKRLWLETPVAISCDKNSIFNSITGRYRKSSLCTIRPVADKIWKGQL